MRKDLEMRYILVALFVLLVSGPAYGDCLYDGVSYPTGTILGPLVCMPDGTWQER
jgi:hypothetical protein